MAHRRERICLLGILCITTSLPSAATMTTQDARISEVTVYRDRAEIVREASVEVPVGASTVSFSGIPAGVESDSLRIKAEGVPSVLGAVELVESAEKPRETAEYVAARNEVLRLERLIAETTAEEDVDDELRTFLSSMRATTAKSESKRLGEGRPDPQAISGFYDLLSTKLTSLAEAGIERDDRVRKLNQELRLARAELKTAPPAGEIRSRVADVEIEAKRAGVLTLRLAYVVPRASWYPSYRATLDAESGTVNWVAEGVVRQDTGEDWANVTLSLSTASPSRGVAPPFLKPLTLAPALPPAALAEDEMIADQPVAGRFYQNVLTTAPGVGDSATEAATTQAALIKSAYNVAFHVPGSSDVPADGRDHRVALRTETLRGNLVYRTVPGMASSAYLTSVTTSPSDYPLLAGTVRVFAEGAYLGRFQLEETGPGLELTVPFGVDNRVEVIRVPLPESAGKQGLAGKQRETAYGSRTQLHNLQDRAVTLVLEDRIPVARDERIVVELDKQTTDGFIDSPRRPGVKLLTLELGPGEKREIVFAFSVRHPKDLVVAESE